ncbi:hypothetical protein AAFF_G00124490 [Aldrovandia affinis]|uniref:E3 ubiquitin-protein ligase n=1 Tax=Aldrovandia affinis TaxID=143900 RepID=A0AAD7W9P5_9TELE|nr:hypothetical protein AAFF_G00124490 [Aldrovandia affinis]
MPETADRRGQGCSLLPRESHRTRSWFIFANKFRPKKPGTMGTIHSKEKWDCTQYLNGKGPLTPEEMDGAGAGGGGEGVAHSQLVAGGGESRRIEGDQPEGEMKWTSLARSLPGHPHCGTIKIDYVIKDGIQTEQHPNPGKPFFGLSAEAFLPDDREGKRVLKLLERAFDQRLVFTVASNRGGEETVTWNDIPHKTFDSGGPESDSYPDPHYLQTVKKVLKAKGIK